MVRMAWNILETKAAPAEENMQLDAKLLANLEGGERPILHLYEWEKQSATFGYFVKPEDLLDLAEAKKRGLDLARRPTGGGVVFHLWDLAFSVLVPAKSKLFSTNTLDNYNLINQVVKDVVKKFIGRGNCKTAAPQKIDDFDASFQGQQAGPWRADETMPGWAGEEAQRKMATKGRFYGAHEFYNCLDKDEIDLTPDDAPFEDLTCTHFCMARPTKYDVMLQGKKIAGAAQRKTKDGFLHQGTIALLCPDLDLLGAVLPSVAVREAMMQTTFALLSDPKELKEGRRELCEKLKSEFIKL